MNTSLWSIQSPWHSNRYVILHFENIKIRNKSCNRQGYTIAVLRSAELWDPGDEKKGEKSSFFIIGFISRKSNNL